VNQPLCPVLATDNAILLARKLEQPLSAVALLNPEFVLGPKWFFGVINPDPGRVVEIGRIPPGRVT